MLWLSLLLILLLKYSSNYVAYWKMYACLCGVAFSQLTLEDVDSVSELGDAAPRRGIQPRNLPMSYSSWLAQFNTNPYGPSNLGHLSNNLGHIPAQSSRQPSDVVYAPPPPYNVVTADGAKVVMPGGCGSFYAACRSNKDPRNNRSRSGLMQLICLHLCLSHAPSTPHSTHHLTIPLHKSNAH